MKGNIGPTKKSQFLSSEMEHNKKKLFSRIAEEFDIDRIIPDNKNLPMQQPQNNASERSFNLSDQKDDEIDSIIAYSEDNN